MQVDPTPSTSTSAAPAQSPETLALGLYARSVLDLLKLWPALRIILSYELDPKDWPAVRDDMAMQIVDLVYTAATERGEVRSQLQGTTGSTSTHENGIPLPRQDKIEDLLVWAMKQEFGDDVDLEDGSEAQVAKDLLALWRECLQQVLAGKNEEGPIAVKFRELAAKADREGGQQQQHHHDNSSDDDEDYTDDEEMVELVDQSGQPSSSSAPAPAPQRQEPVVDEDGFEMVQPKKKGGRR